MSTVRVGQPSPPTQSSHQPLPVDDVEPSGFRPRPAPRDYSRMPIIVVDDDSYPEAERRVRSYRPGSMNGRPPATARRVAYDSSVTVIGDTGVVGSSQNRRTRNGAQSRPIVVLDSDEEQGQPSGLAGSMPRTRRTRASSFRIFSPPPPPQPYHPIPPVPALPPLIAEPLPFAVLPPPSRQNQRQSHLPFDGPPQSANSHNNANGRSNGAGSGIQLGGGLLSQGTNSGRRLGPRTQIRFQAPNIEVYDGLSDGATDVDASLGHPSAVFTNFLASYFSRNSFLSLQSDQNSSRGRSRVNQGNIPLRQLHQALTVADLGGDPGPLPGAGFFGLSSYFGPWGRRDESLGIGADYEKKLTHPEPAGPGWTHDFGTEEEEGTSKAQVEGSEILVCAKCLDPLLANTDGMVDVSEEESKARRVWGLRCGHVLDGKCVACLMIPERKAELADEENVEVVDLTESGRMGKRRRKGKEVKVESISENEVNGLVTTLDVKGKGKAPAAPVNDSVPPPSEDRAKMPLPSPSSELADNVSSQDTSMLSRLRPRRAAAVSSPPVTVRTLSCSIRPRRPPPQPVTLGSVTRGGSSSTQRRGTKRKRATNPEAKLEVVEERYEWTCPVPGCGRVHISLKLGGQWRMDPNNGAVGMYL